MLTIENEASSTLTYLLVEAGVDTQHSSVRRILEEGKQLRREQEVSEIVHGQVGFQALIRHLSALKSENWRGGGGGPVLILVVMTILYAFPCGGWGKRAR